MEEKYVEVDGQKFVDDGAGSPKVDVDGNRVPFVEQSVPFSRFKEVNEYSFGESGFYPRSLTCAARAKKKEICILRRA